MTVATTTATAVAPGSGPARVTSTSGVAVVGEGAGIDLAPARGSGPVGPVAGIIGTIRAAVSAHPTADLIRSWLPADRADVTAVAEARVAPVVVGRPGRRGVGVALGVGVVALSVTLSARAG